MRSPDFGRERQITTSERNSVGTQFGGIEAYGDYVREFLGHSRVLKVRVGCSQRVRSWVTQRASELDSPRRPVKCEKPDFVFALYKLCTALAAFARGPTSY